jgi:hypothetical protein
MHAVWIVSQYVAQSAASALPPAPDELPVLVPVLLAVLPPDPVEGWVLLLSPPP